MKSARENIQKSARERKNLPVNFSKKCPWTQKHAREHFWKREVHGHFWGSRVKKKNPGKKLVSRSLFYQQRQRTRFVSNRDLNFANKTRVRKTL